MTKKKPESIYITKASGERQPFQPDKLYNSLRKSGASEELANHIINEIVHDLYEGMSTKKIYQKAYKLLKKESQPFAAKYNLKKALLAIGPSGFPFEHYVGEIMKSLGYQVKVNEILHGYCVDHEVDVVAEKDGKRYMVECKFHNRPGYICDVKIPLYIQSRFLDLQRNGKESTRHLTFDQGWLVTNTRFSQDAIQYGQCAGLYLLSWDFPKKDSLQKLIDRTGLHPITALTSLTKDEKNALLKQRVVLCREILHNQAVLDYLKIPNRRKNMVLKECRYLCNE